MRARSQSDKVPLLTAYCVGGVAELAAFPPRYLHEHINNVRLVMPFLLPVLIGIPVLVGGGYIVYTIFH
jgi:hypothetical protein